MRLRLRSRRPSTGARPAPRVRRGFGLVEVIVAMTLLAVVLSSLAALAFQASRRARQVGTGSNRTQAIAEQFNKWSAADFNKGLNADGTVTTTVSGSFPYTLTVVTSTDPTTPNHRIIAVTIRPADALLAAETVTIERWRPSTTNPLSNANYF